jgi:hypothetical protein
MDGTQMMGVWFDIQPAGLSCKTRPPFAGAVSRRAEACVVVGSNGAQHINRQPANWCRANGLAGAGRGAPNRRRGGAFHCPKIRAVNEWVMSPLRGSRVRGKQRMEGWRRADSPGAGQRRSFPCRSPVACQGESVEGAPESSCRRMRRACSTNCRLSASSSTARQPPRT